MNGVPISVVIPTLDEVAALPATLAACAVLGPHEAIVADGGSRDGTIEAARRAGARVVRAAGGRGAQCAAGAAVARYPLLCFLHADTRLPRGAGAMLRRTLARRAVAAAVFRLRLDGDGAGLRVAEAAALFRTRWFGQPAGDQALACSRDALDAAGGYPAVPLFEDLEAARRLARVGRLVMLPGAAVSSARRYSAGPWRRMARNVVLRGRHAFGEAPAELARRYGLRPAAPPEVVALVARAPGAEPAKTRLAAAIGAEGAARVHRALGAAVAARLSPALGPGRAGWAFMSPPAALEAAGDWLGDPWRTLPQVLGDLGARLDAATGWAFAAGAERVLLVGSDAPEVTPADVDAAFAALAGADVALGPAADGGYWALGLRRPAPALFRGIPWGTAGVAAATRAAAARAGLTVASLRELADVDRVEDLRALVARLAAGDDTARAIAAELASAL